MNAYTGNVKHYGNNKPQERPKKYNEIGEIHAEDTWVGEKG